MRKAIRKLKPRLKRVSKTPIRELVLQALERHRSRLLLASAVRGETADPEVGMTASQISQDIREKIASVSSVLNKLAASGAIERETGKGPRGGYIYRLSTPSKLTVQRKTSWERIRRG